MELRVFSLNEPAIDSCFSRDKSHFPERILPFIVIMIVMIIIMIIVISSSSSSSLNKAGEKEANSFTGWNNYASLPLAAGL